MKMQRAIGVVVLLLAAFGALMLWLGLSTSNQGAMPNRRTLHLGDWEIYYDTQAPTLATVLIAIVVALVAAATVTIVERRIATAARRSEEAGKMPLAPKIVMADTRGVFHGPVTVTVLIPAHNEAQNIANTITSLRDQHDPPERIIVVADNCTDDTEQIATDLGVEVFRTVDNTKKKAGGLNQKLAEILPELGENDTVMIMDADTVLDQGYMAEAKRRFTADRALMAVGGLFYGEPGAGMLGQFQRNEYTRYSRDIARRRGMVFVLTGTASVFRARALRTVADSRGTLIPGHRGEVYDTEALTEDNEITIAIKTLGGLMVSPPECTVVTEVMPTWKQLWHQRLRWQRGALENLGAYGLTPQTSRYWTQQLGLGYGVVALLSYFVLIALMLLAIDEWMWYPFWISIGVLFAIERTIGVWRSTWKARLLALILLPELLYASFLNLVFCKGVAEILIAKKAKW